MYCCFCIWKENVHLVCPWCWNFNFARNIDVDSMEEDVVIVGVGDSDVNGVRKA